MVYWLESDTFADDPVWEALSGANGDLEDRLQAAYCRLKATASHLLSNGYLAERKALELCRGRRRVLELLCSIPLADRSPLLHRKGDVCDCLTDDWVDGYAYRIHAFLKRNPARAEVQRNQAMKADGKNHRLRGVIFERDGGCCRYCRSGPLPKNGGRNLDRRKVRTYDHVDPDVPAGPDGEGYVVACDRCNSEKGHRLPPEAEMTLLDEPTQEEAAAWLARELLVFDRPAFTRQANDGAGLAPETRRDGAESAPTRSERGADPAAIADADRDADTGAKPCPHQVEGHRDGAEPGTANPSGSGRGVGYGANAHGPPLRKPLETQPRRTSAEPDIYTGRSRASPAPDLPPLHWPPGSVPVGRRRRQEDRFEEERPPWT